MYDKTLRHLGHSLQKMDMDTYKDKLSKADLGFLLSHAAFSQQVLEFEPGQRGVVVNGKVGQDSYS